MKDKDPNFYKTPMGKKYYDHDLPRLIESQNRLAAAIEKQNKINEQSNRLETVKLRNNGPK